MNKITAEEIKSFREKTGLGVLDCKKFLDSAGGDVEKALVLAKDKIGEAALKRAERETKEGVIVSYIHSNKKVGVLLELFCETDFVAKNDEFIELANNIAIHIAAMNPEFLSVQEAPRDMSEQEKEEKALLCQKYFKDPTKDIQGLIKEKIQRIGENIKIGRFIRYQL